MREEMLMLAEQSSKLLMVNKSGKTFFDYYCEAKDLIRKLKVDGIFLIKSSAFIL